MNEMNAKKNYVWSLGEFLDQHRMRMSGEELAEHLNRNKFPTRNGDEYAGGRGTYKLIRETWIWLNDDLGLPDEAAKVARAFVKPDGSYAYQ